MFKRLAIALCLSLPALPALAFDDTDKAAIATSFDGLLSAIETGNYDQIFEVMPPGMLEEMAKQSGMSADQLRVAATEQTKQMMGQVTLEESTYDLDAATTGTSSAGRDYAVVPTRSVMKLGEERIEATGGTLAVEDGGKWYLIRIETPAHMQLVGQIYPDLADLPVPPSNMRNLE